MHLEEHLGEATLRRLENRERNVIVAQTNAGSLHEAWLEHSRTWELDPDPLSSTMMRQGLAALALHLSSRPRDETTGFTFNFREPPLNIFLTGDASESTVTGRAYRDDVRTAKDNRLYVQTRRRDGKQSDSYIEFQGLDLVDIFEQYYERSEQYPARFFELSENDFGIVAALPGASSDWLFGLEREEFAPLVAESRPLEDRIFRFGCGCNPQRMLVALRSVFQDDPDALFEGQDRVEAFCPRCGRRWWIARESY